MHITAYITGATIAGGVGKLVPKELVDKTASCTASIVNCFADVLELAETRYCMWAMPHCWSTKGERWFRETVTIIKAAEHKT